LELTLEGDILPYGHQFFAANTPQWEKTPPLIIHVFCLLAIQYPNQEHLYFLNEGTFNLKFLNKIVNVK
jgi:hypothetical protein